MGGDCGGGGGQVTAHIEPLDRYIWRSTRGGCGSLHRVYGSVADVVSNLRKKSAPTRKSAQGRRDTGMFAGSARVALIGFILLKSGSLGSSIFF
jgi:hypothetical protein